MGSDTFLLAPGQTWVALGDSITENPDGYVAMCERCLRPKLPDIKVINAGVGGNKARDMVARFDRDVLSHNPDVASISVGVNDVWHGFHDFEKNAPRDHYEDSFGEVLAEYRSDLDWMAAKLAEREITTIFVSPTMIGEDPLTRENRFLADYIEAMKEVSNTYNAVYCPMNESLWHWLLTSRSQDVEIPLTTDGVHMTEMGTHLMCATLLISFAHGSNFPALP